LKLSRATYCTANLAVCSTNKKYLQRQIKTNFVVLQYIPYGTMNIAKDKQRFARLSITLENPK
jgi:hypothetical protein